MLQCPCSLCFNSPYFPLCLTTLNLSAIVLTDVFFFFLQIVRNDRTLEQIVFPIPEICEYLTQDTKVKIFNTAERDDQGSKVADFFERTEPMFNEMKWQKKLRGQPFLFWVSSFMSLWSNMLFNCVVLSNLIVAFFYPFDNTVPGMLTKHPNTLHSHCWVFFVQTKRFNVYSFSFLLFYFFFSLELSSHISWLIWSIMLISAAIVITLPRESGVRTLVASIILRFIFSVGPEPTLWILGSVTVCLKSVHIISLIGNHGTLEKNFLKIITDVELLYHFGYIMFCVLGILMHPFFYSILVSFS